MKKYSKNKYCFASEFASARLEAGFSISGTANICARSERTIEDWEAGRTPVPAWALRLIILESRYMAALYDLQRDRGYTGNAVKHRKITFAANDHRLLTLVPSSRGAAR
jgi:hypothetical protein